jgi:tetratricopeptide (TPR) repeat protein
MRRVILGILVSLATPAMPLGAAWAAPAAADSQQNVEAAAIDQAFAAIGAKDPAKAIALVEPIIAAQDAAHRKDPRRYYSAGSPTETLAYAGLGARDGKETVVVGPEWGTANFVKGFALIDLGKSDEARKYLERAVELSPFNAQFLGELGEWHKARHEWPQAYELFQRGEAVANMMPSEDSQKYFLRRALRGQGYVLIEQGKLDQAEALFRRCLQIDPDDAGAKNELNYIAQQRQKRSSS